MHYTYKNKFMGICMHVSIQIVCIVEWYSYYSMRFAKLNFLHLCKRDKAIIAETLEVNWCTWTRMSRFMCNSEATFLYRNGAALFLKTLNTTF